MQLSHPGFELGATSPFPMTLTVISRDVGYTELIIKTGNMLTITIFVLFILTDREIQWDGFGFS